MRRLSIVTVLLLIPASLAAQDPPARKLTPVQQWTDIRLEYDLGNYDIALDKIDEFLKGNPSDADLSAIEDRFGIASFLELRLTERWKVNKKADLDARAKVEQLIGRVNAAVRTTRGDPVRLARLARNLTASPEEEEFAKVELRKAGFLSPPVLWDVYNDQADNDLKRAILEFLPTLDLTNVPAVLTLADSDDKLARTFLIQGLAARPDFRKLTGKIETNPLPLLWYFASPAFAKNDPDTAELASKVLATLIAADPSKRVSEAEIAAQIEDVRLKRRPFATVGTPDVWSVSGKTLTRASVSESIAEEQYALRYGRYGLRVNPTYRPLIEQYLAVAVDKSALRTGFEKPLLQGNPQLEEILGSAPRELLQELLERGLREKNQAMLLAIIPVIDRRAERSVIVAEKRTANRAGSRESILAEALRFPSPRVRIVAAEAFLAIPGDAAVNLSAQVIEALGDVLAGGLGNPAKPKLMIGDPDAVRGRSLARLGEAAGYEVVFASSARELIQRGRKSPNFDLILVSGSLGGPLLTDLLAQRAIDSRLGTVPTFVLATSLEPKKELASLFALEKIVKNYPDVRLSAEPVNPEEFRVSILEPKAESDPFPVSPAERKALARRAADLLGRAALNPAYDLRPIEDKLVAALAEPELGPLVVDAVARFKSRDVQSSIFNVALNAALPKDYRLKAMEALAANVSLQGSGLVKPQTDALIVALGDRKDPEIRAGLTTLAGRLGVVPVSIGAQLLEYVPATPAMPKEVVPEPKKEAEPKKED